MVTKKKKAEREEQLQYLPGTLREGVFSRPELRELRKKGLVPGRIQTGKGPKGAIYVAMELAALRRAAQYRTLHNRLWKVCLPDREPLTCLIREMQTHHINDEDIIHVNFVHYVPGVPRMVEVPIEVVNLERSPGVKRGGSFSLVMPTLKCVVKGETLPLTIKIDVGHMEVDERLWLSQVSLEEGVEPAPLEHYKTAVVALVQATRVSMGKA